MRPRRLRPWWLTVRRPDAPSGKTGSNSDVRKRRRKGPMQKNRSSSGRSEDLHRLSILATLKNTYPEARRQLRRQPADLAVPGAITAAAIAGLTAPVLSAWIVVAIMLLTVLYTLHLVGKAVAKGGIRKLADEMSALPGREGEAAIARNRHDLATLREEVEQASVTEA